VWKGLLRSLDWTELASDDSDWSNGWVFYDSDLPVPAAVTLVQLCGLAKAPRDDRGV
jgi:hypothetical protein